MARCKHGIGASCGAVSVLCRATITEVNTTSELAAIQKNYSVVFMIVHDKTVDQDWHGIFARQARDKALKAKFAFTKNPEIVQVCMLEQFIVHVIDILHTY